MNRDPLASFSKEELIALIEALTKQIGMLTKRVEALEAELRKPPKTPDNSSVPPSQGHKANGESETKPKAKAHAGSHRPLHPNPTRRRDVLADRCEHCRADVSAVLQTAVHAYDRIEIPEIVPEVTRGHRQVVGCWIVKGAMDRSTVVGRRDHAAMATPVTSAQVANAWRRAA